jgi:hypothetical protein
MAPFSFMLPSFTFPDGFWIGIVTSLVATVLIVILSWLSNAVQRLLQRHSQFTLSGVWIGACELPHYPPDTEAIEIYRLVQRGDHVSFKFFNYRPDVGKVLKYLGAGICRGQLLSAFYYIPMREKSDSGVFIVRKVGETLKGVYAQYDLRAAEALKISAEDFVLSRIEIPRWNRMRMAAGFRPYATHREVRALYDGTQAEQSLPGSSSVQIDKGPKG